MRIRYSGMKPYTENESDIFFGRQSKINELYKTTVFEKNSILHSSPLAGKTSILRAGLMPFFKNSEQFEIFYINIPKYKKSGLELKKIVEKSLKINPNSMSYIDKLVANNNSFWYDFKKLQAVRTGNKTIILIFDSFENFFTYPKEKITEFNTGISSALYEIIPKNIKTEIREKISKNPELLTSAGSNLLYSPLKIKILFSIRTKNLNKLQNLSNIYFGIEKNVIKLDYFNKNQTCEIIKKSSEFVSKSNTDIDFKTNSYKFSDDLIENILNFLSKKGKIFPYELQIILKYSEDFVSKKNISELKNNNFTKLNTIFEEFYKKSFNKIQDKNNKNNFINFVENELILFSENRLLSVYDGIIKERYNLKNSFFDENKNLIISEINEKNEIYRKLNSNKFTNAVINFKTKRKQYQERISEEKKETELLKKEAENQIKKSKKIKNILFLSIVAFVFSTVGILLINKARKKAQNNEKLAKSSVFTAYAFQELEKNPTKAFRYAEKAYKLDKNNPAAYSALINSYYSAEAFYSVLKKIDNETITAKISPNGKLLLSVIRNKKSGKFIIKLEEISGNELFKITHNKIISNIDFSKDSQKIEFCDISGTVFLCDTKGKKIKEFKAHNFMIWRAVFSPDMKKVLTSGADKKIILWTTNGKKISELPKHDFDVYALDFSPDGKYIATAVDNSINICNMKGKLIKSIPLPEKNSYYFPLIQEIKFSSDSKKLLIAVNDMAKKNHVVRIIDISGNDIMLFRGHKDWINTANFSKDNSKIITSSIDNNIMIWKIDGELIGILKGHKAKVIDAKFSENSNTIISVSDDKTLRQWNFGRLLNPLEKIENIKSAVFSPDGLKILTAHDSTVDFLDLTGDIIQKYKGNKKKINSIDISKNGEFIATAGKDKTVRIWNTDGKQTAILKGHKKSVNSAVFMPDSNLLISAGNDSMIILWDTKKRKILRKIKSNSKINSVDFSPEKQKFITAEKSGNLIMRDLNGKIIRHFSGHHADALSGKFSPDGKYIISTSKDRSAILWKISGEIVHIFDTYSSRVNSAEFSGNGKYILTASNDNKVKLYNLSGKDIATFNHRGKVLSAVFSPDGKYILSVISLKNKNTAKLQVIKPDKILELTNDIKIFGDFYNEDFLLK